VFDWNELRYFLAVARTDSTIAAAKLLGVNQSTVQRRLAALEKQLKRRLVERLPTGYRLTELGEQLRPQAEAVEEKVAAFERSVASADEGLTGTIRLTCPAGFADRLVRPILDGFQARYPDVRVDLVLADRYLDFAKGEADIALRAGEPGEGALIRRKVGAVAWAVYASRSYVERHGRPHHAEDVRHHAVIAFDSVGSSRRASQWLQSVAPQTSIVARSNTTLGLLVNAKRGIGLALLPTHIGDHEEDLLRVLDPVPELITPIYLVLHPDLRNTPRIRAFIDFVVAEKAALRPLLPLACPRGRAYS
jgi:DNA-binding transcriptional LysR family regulator